MQAVQAYSTPAPTYGFFKTPETITQFWLAARAIQDSANDNEKPKPDRWAILILKWSEMGFERLALRARQCRIDGWDFDAFCDLLLERHEQLMAEGR